jgi:peptide/nickel transport system permease protein
VSFLTEPQYDAPGGAPSGAAARPEVAMSQRLAFILRRLAQAVPILAAIVVINFLLLQLAPGDAVDVLAGEAGSATPEYMAELRAKFGLDQPIPVQLANYAARVATGDFGWSFRHEMPVSDLVLQRLGPTLILMGATILIAVGVGALLGLLAATGLNTWRDNLISVLALVSYATPLFWVGLMLILVFSVNLGWFPTSGMETIAAFHSGWDRVWDVLHHLVLPATTLSLFYLALYTRLMRASMLEQAGMDYVVTARAKGLSERRIVWRHVLRNALLPVVTMAGVQVSSLIGGSVIVETVFGWPGLGQLAFESLFARDLNLLLGIFLLSAVLVLAVNLAVDILYTLLDPRIELR